MRFLHWVSDDKFIDVLISVMEYTKGEHSHVYAIITENGKTDLEYIQEKSYIRFVNPKDFTEVIKNYDVFVLHSLKAEAYDFLNNLPQHIKVLWSAWGYDLYSTPSKIHPFIKIPLYRSMTKKAIRAGIKACLATLYMEIKYLRNRAAIEKAISRIDYFSGVIPQEYNLMTKKSFFRARQVDFHYFRLDDEVSEDQLECPLPTGYNIFVGNSGDPSNNHLDAFEYLHHIDIADSKIYVPLSYGGSAVYRERVKLKGKEYWGDSFIAIEKFMPYKEYCDIISSCSNVIMFHERQQAMGNVRHGLWSGSRVFLSDSGLVYKFYKDLGINVFSVQNELSTERIKVPLSPNEIRLNRKRMLDTVSRLCLMKDIIRMYEILEEK